MGLYERILQEATQEARENPDREEQRRRWAYKRQRMQAYIRRRRRRAVPRGGYVSSAEIKEEQERHLKDLKVLCDLMAGGGRSMGASYRLAHLRSKYPMEYAHLRDIETSSG